MEGFSHVVQHGHAAPTGLRPYTKHHFGLIDSLGEEQRDLMVYFIVSPPTKQAVAIANAICGEPREVVPSLHPSISLGPAQHRRPGEALKASVPCMRLHGDSSTQSCARPGTSVTCRSLERGQVCKRWDTKPSRLGAGQWQNTGLYGPSASPLLHGMRGQSVPADRCIV